MRLKKHRDNAGKFVQKPQEDKTIYKSVRLPESQVKQLEAIASEDETFSDVAREAIAYFLKNFPRTN